MLQTESPERVDGLQEAIGADASVAVGFLAKAERCATDVLARLGQSHSMARLLEGQAASVAAQLPEMQASPACPHLAPCCSWQILTIALLESGSYASAVLCCGAAICTHEIAPVNEPAMPSHMSIERYCEYSPEALIAPIGSSGSGRHCTQAMPLVRASAK